MALHAHSCTSSFYTVAAAAVIGMFQKAAFDVLSQVLLLILLLAAQVAQAWKWALLVHVLSWYMQIHPGHAILEGRKPALLDSLVQVRGEWQQQRCAGCCAGTCMCMLWQAGAWLGDAGGSSDLLDAMACSVSTCSGSLVQTGQVLAGAVRAGCDAAKAKKACRS
jgi:hypothetical protein